MKKTIISGFALGLTLLFVTMTAYPWNYATHAYIAAKIGKKLPLPNANEMYGCMSPDIFNLEFNLLDDMLLRAFTHGIPKDDPINAPSQAFMRVWWKANTPFQKFLAFGYLAHNDAWGADYVAHWKAIPCPPPFEAPYQDQPPGYIIALAVEMDKILEAQGVWYGLQQAGIPLGIPERMMFCHNIVEYAGDIIIKRAVPLIGQKIIDACLLRSPEFPRLLKKAYPAQYRPLIEPAEETFRQQMIQYGGLLLLPESTAIQFISQQLAGFAIDYLAFLFGVDPLKFEPYRPTLELIANGAMNAGVQLCEAFHYLDEVKVTALYVQCKFMRHQVYYFRWR